MFNLLEVDQKNAAINRGNLVPFINKSIIHETFPKFRRLFSTKSFKNFIEISKNFEHLRLLPIIMIIKISRRLIQIRILYYKEKKFSIVFFLNASCIIFGISYIIYIDCPIIAFNITGNQAGNCFYMLSFISGIIGDVISKKYPSMF